MRKVDFILMSILFFLVIVTCKQQDKKAIYPVVNIKTGQGSFYPKVNSALSLPANSRDFLDIYLDFNNLYCGYEQLIFQLKQHAEGSLSQSVRFFETSQILPLQIKNNAFFRYSIPDIQFKQGEVYHLNFILKESTLRCPDTTYQFQFMIE